MSWKFQLRKLERHFFEGRMLLQVILASTVQLWIWFSRLIGRQTEARALAWWIMSSFSRRVFALRNCTVQVEGLEHIPTDHPFVVMANHQSRYDIVLLEGFLGRPVGFVAKKELFRIPGVAFWMRQVHSISIDRKDVVKGAASLERLGQELMAHNRGIIIFPEGTRTRDPGGEIQGFRQGSLRLASDYQIPVLPVSLDGTRYLSLFERYADTPPSERLVRLTIAAPMIPKGKSAPERKRFMDELRETIVSNWKLIRVEWRRSE